jgi:hypothetical protein
MQPAPPAPAEEKDCAPNGMKAPCCQSHAQPEYTATAAAPPVPLPAFAPTHPVIEESTYIPIISPAGNHLPGRSRPLYLTQSCYLI